VAVGLTTDRYLAGHPKPDAGRIQSYATRRRALLRWLSSEHPENRWTVVALEDAFGRSVEEGVDVLVVSADTVTGAHAVNAERRRRGLRVVPVVVVPLVLADDLVPVSSRRIRAGEIDSNGRRRSRIEVRLAVEAPGDREPAARGIRRAFPRAHVTSIQGFATRAPGAAGRARHQIAPGAEEGGGLGVTVAGTSGGKRCVVVRSASVELEPATLRYSSAAAFSTALGRFLRRSASAKR
jgi:phosphopantetheine adenylyltransferase